MACQRAEKKLGNRTWTGFGQCRLCGFFLGPQYFGRTKTCGPRHCNRTQRAQLSQDAPRLWMCVCGLAQRSSSSAVPSFGQQMGDRTLPSLEHCSMQQTSHPAATANRCRQHHISTGGTHEIQMALSRRRVAMTRAVLPNPSARAEYLLADLMDRAHDHWVRAPLPDGGGNGISWGCQNHDEAKLSMEMEVTVAAMLVQTPPYLMTMTALSLCRQSTDHITAAIKPRVVLACLLGPLSLFVASVRCGA